MIDSDDRSAQLAERASDRGSTPAPQPFDNRAFWEERYTTNLELGSGAGSRGEFLALKRDLLQQMIEAFQPRSILDVGCGDIEVTREIDFSGEYTGIDLSPSIVARNKTLRPEWSFIQGDFLEIAQREPVAADFVVCLDVLIHQHDYETYRSFARELLNVTRTVALINGFEDLGSSSGSKNVAYHEPLTKTLAEMGADRMKVIMLFRKMLMIQVEKEPAEFRPPTVEGDAAARSTEQPEADTPVQIEWAVEREAPKSSRQVEKEQLQAEKEARLAEKEVRKAKREALKAENEARNAEREARKAENEARNAEREARKAEKEARNAEKEARLAERQARRASRTRHQSATEADSEGSP